jgi:hypothetical protein
MAPFNKARNMTKMFARFGYQHRFLSSRRTAPSSQHSNNKKNPRALVVLIGWFGAQSKHLLKYADSLYHSNNITTIIVTTDPLSLMFRMDCALEHCARRVAEEVAQELDNNNNKDLPVFTHAFSNGGAFVVDRLEVLMEQAKRKKKKKDHGGETDVSKNLLLLHEAWKGQIFDSAPAYISLTVGFRVASTAFPDNFLMRWLGSFGFVSMRLFQRAKGMLGFVDGAEEFWNNMRNSSCCKHQLYIYSTADIVTDSSKLDELIACRRRRRKNDGDGLNIAVCRFEDSSHVQHFPKHPFEYKEAVEMFLERTLSNIWHR